MSEFPEVTVKEWRARVCRELGDSAFDDLGARTVEGFRLGPLYTRARPDGGGSPGCLPFVRGSRPGPSERGWERCQRYDDPDIDVVATQVATDTDNGVDGIWLRLDRGARLGVDPTTAAGSAMVGQEGLAAYTAVDLERVLAGVDLGLVGLSVDAGGNALPLAALLLVALERSGVDVAGVPIRFNADPLAALAHDGALPAPHATLGWEAAVLARYCAARLPLSRALTVSVAPYGRAGATAVQELGFAMATGAEYLRYLAAAGVAADIAAAQIAFSFELGRDFLVEMAKLRAARWLWAKVLGACRIESSGAFLHASTSWRTLARQDPWINMMRTTIQATAAILADVDSLTTAAFDEVLGRTDARGRRVARNAQAILREESHLGTVADPAGGSYAIEALTEELARQGWSLLRRIDATGMAGSLLAKRVNPQVRELVETAWQARCDRLRDGRDAVLGVSAFAPESPSPLHRERPDREAVRLGLLERLRVRPEIEAGVLEAVRGAVNSTTAATGPDALLEALLEAARAGATIGELSRALREPEPSETIEPFPERRDAALFETNPAGTV